MAQKTQLQILANCLPRIEVVAPVSSIAVVFLAEELIKSCSSSLPSRKQSRVFSWTVPCMIIFHHWIFYVLIKQVIFSIAIECKVLTLTRLPLFLLNYSISRSVPKSQLSEFVSFVPTRAFRWWDAFCFRESLYSFGFL
jgi:hypothetical protein